MSIRLLIYGVLGVAALLIWPRPTAPTQATVAVNAAPAPASSWRESFARDVLAGLGNRSPTPATIEMIVQWTIAEDGSDGAYLRHNPLNTTQPGFGETVSINDDGVRGYATYPDGVAATVQTLSYGPYIDVVAALRANDPDRAKQALWASPWASSHYGYGAAWPK